MDYYIYSQKYYPHMYDDDDDDNYDFSVGWGDEAYVTYFKSTGKSSHTIHYTIHTQGLSIYPWWCPMCMDRKQKKKAKNRKKIYEKIIQYDLTIYYNKTVYKCSLLDVMLPKIYLLSLLNETDWLVFRRWFSFEMN